MGRALDASGQARDGFVKVSEGRKNQRGLHTKLCIAYVVLVEKSGSRVAG